MGKLHKSPKRGTTNDTPQSESQPDGTGAEAPRGETQARQSINPSAPSEGTEGVENAGPHPSTKGSGLSDTFGEAGDPHGRGNLQIPDQTINQKKNFPDSNYAGNTPSADQPGSEGAGNMRRKRDEEAA